MNGFLESCSTNLTLKCVFFVLFDVLFHYTGADMVIIVTVNLVCFDLDIKKSVEIAMYLLFCFFLVYNG